jgi:uncharacterized protein YutE (UPF0331/DUF86 family)
VVERDVVTARLAIIDRCLARIAEVRGTDRPELRPIDVEDIIALNLQRAVQATISLASHVVATEGYGTPASTADLFTLLERGEVIDADLADRLRRMVGFSSTAPTLPRPALTP